MRRYRPRSAEWHSSDATQALFVSAIANLKRAMSRAQFDLANVPARAVNLLRDQRRAL
jgi:hypothetical protein